MQTRATLPKQSKPKRLLRVLRPWQAALCAGYVALFAFVMPFLCLGTLAEPGHPHRLPHFVFVDPVLTPSELAGVTQLRIAPDAPAAHHAHTGVSDTNSAEATPRATSKLPAGRAAPTLLLFSLLAPLLLVTWLLERCDQPHFFIRTPQPVPAPIVLVVPVPPPR